MRLPWLKKDPEWVAGEGLRLDDTYSFSVVVDAISGHFEVLGWRNGTYVGRGYTNRANVPRRSCVVRLAKVVRERDIDYLKWSVEKNTRVADYRKKGWR